jgi:hypothetical protein
MQDPGDGARFPRTRAARDGIRQPDPRGLLNDLGVRLMRANVAADPAASPPASRRVAAGIADAGTLVVGRWEGRGRARRRSVPVRRFLPCGGAHV